MKRLVLVPVFCLVLPACGGGGGGVDFRDPDSVHFTFDTGTTPGTGSAEETAASAGKSGVESAFTLPDVPDDGAAGQSQSVAGLPMQMGEVFPGGAPQFPASRALAGAQGFAVRNALALLSGDMPRIAVDPWTPAGCWTVSSTVLTYDHCSQPILDGDTLIGTLSIDGSFHRLAGHVYWDAVLGATADEGVGHVHESFHMKGDITFGAGAIDGYDRAEIELLASAPGVSLHAGVTYDVGLALGYTTDPFCIDDGTMTLKRIWSLTPPLDDFDDPSEATDAAIQISWLGCDAVQVAWGILQ